MTTVSSIFKWHTKCYRKLVLLCLLYTYLTIPKITAGTTCLVRMGSKVIPLLIVAVVYYGYKQYYFILSIEIHIFRMGRSTQNVYLVENYLQNILSVDFDTNYLYPKLFKIFSNNLFVRHPAR